MNRCRCFAFLWLFSSHVCVDSWDVHRSQRLIPTVTVDKLHVLISNNNWPNHGTIGLHCLSKLLTAFCQPRFEVVAGLGNEFVGVRLDFAYLQDLQSPFATRQALQPWIFFRVSSFVPRIGGPLFANLCVDELMDVLRGFNYAVSYPVKPTYRSRYNPLLEIVEFSPER